MKRAILVSILFVLPLGATPDKDGPTLQCKPFPGLLASCARCE